MLQVLDSNEHKMVKIQVLKKKLSLLQKQNQFTSFTLCKEMVQDFMKHAFNSEPDEKNLMHGFTPFCLQQMGKASKINLEKLKSALQHKSTHWAQIF